MKLSCLPVSLYEDIFSGKRSILDWVHFGADLGLDGIDVSVKFFPTRETQMLEAIFEEAQRAELDICTLVCYPDFTHSPGCLSEREGDRTDEIRCSTGCDSRSQICSCNRWPEPPRPPSETGHLLGG